MSSFYFEKFELRPTERKLFNDGKDIALGSRAFDMLCFLVENRQRFLSKAEILDAIWPDIAVEESNLTVQISALRKALGAKALVTIPGRGYQFVLPVETGSVEAIPMAEPALATQGFTVLVLPFANTSNDPEQEYFSDGITEDIITDLSKVSALSVISRSTAFTFKGRAIDVVELAKQKNVSHVVEGSVRKSGGHVRISAQLVDGKSGHQLWADRFDRELTNIFALQDEIAKAIVSALSLKLVPAEQNAIKSRPTDNPQAYEIYLQARYHSLRLDRRNYAIAGRLAQQALDIDPNYDRAWALLALSQAGLYGLTTADDYGLEAAERALALNPNLADALAAKARVLAGIGDFDEALELHARSLQLDPDSHDVRFLYGRTCFQAGRHNEAIEHGEYATKLSETALAAVTNLSMSYRAIGRLDLAHDAQVRTVERVERAIAENAFDTYALICGVNALATLGEAEKAKQWAQRVKAIDPEDPSVDYNIACAMATLGETDEALDVLEDCMPRVNAIVFYHWMKQDTDLDSLRDLPRFHTIMQDIEARALALKAKTGDSPAPETEQ